MLSKLTDNKYDENGETLISNNTPRSTTEQSTLLKEQDDENCGNFNASNQIYNRARVVDKNEQILEDEHSKSTNNQLTEHSLSKCQYCNTIFPYSLGQLHAQTCNESMANRTANVLQENLKKCQFCRSIFPDSLLEQHIQTCNKRKIHRCSECNKVFRILSKLRVHQQSHSEERLYSCKICAKPFKFKSGLSRHMKQQHSGEDANKFDTNSLCSELQGLEYASLQDDNVQTYEIGNLTRTDLKTSRLKEYGSLHEDLNHQKNSDHYKMVLNKSGHEKYKENSLVKQHSDRDKTDLRAAMQGRENSSYSHEDESLVKGDDYFESIVNQHDHCQSKETSVGDEKVRQDPNSFTNEGEDLKQNDACDGNVKEVNFEVKARSRRISNECFPNLVPSVTMQSCAENKVYRCPECPRTFEKPSRLEIHQRSHSDEKLFACEICQQTFKYKGSLSRHIREQHYGQGRKGLSMALDGKQRNEQESCLSLGKLKLGNEDRYLTNVTEPNDGVFRHWKERHYSQERTSFSMVCERQRNKPEDCSSLGKINFENNDKCLVSLDKSLGDEVTGPLKGQDVGPRSPSKVVETEINKPENCSSLEKNEFQNDDENLSKQNESLERKETNNGGESSDEGDNYLSMVFGKRQDGKTFTLKDESSRENGKNYSEVQGQKNLRMIVDEKQEDRKSLSSQDEESFEDVDNTNEQNARDSETVQYEENNFEENDSDPEENNLSMVYHHSQGNQKNLSSQDENSLQNVGNTKEQNARDSECFKYEENNFEESNSELEEYNLSMVYHRQRDIDNSSQFHMKVTETCKFGENDFELQERSKQEESDFANRGRNLEEHSLEREGNIFEGNSRVHEAFNGCSSNAIVAVNTQNRGKNKIYQCDVCQKVFVKRSAWANHKRTHNDDMSFACEICWKYFKYKGSLSRHIKEQHYGMGRKDQGYYNISNSSPSRDNLHKDVQRFAPIMNEAESTTPGNNNSCSSKGEYSPQIRVDKFGTILNQPDNRESNLNARDMIFDKRPESDSTYSSIQNVNLGSALAVNQVNSKDSNFAVEKFAESNFVKEKNLDIKHNEQNNDETMLTAVNLYIKKKDDLNENESSSESSLQNTEQEERMSESRQGKCDVLDELQNLPVEITCEICGRCFKHKGSLNRHVKEQHYGLGRKGFRTNVDENQGEVNYYARGENNFENRVDCSRAMMNYEDVNYTDGTLSMVPVANEGNGNGCSSLAKLNLQNRVINLGKTVNGVLCKDDESREETFEPKQSYFEMKSDEHSKKQGLNKMSSLENMKERNSKQEYFDDKQTNDSTKMKKASRAVQEEDSLNKNECSFEDVLQDVGQEERQMDSNEDSFDVGDDNLETSPPELTCGICGKDFKHKGSLNRHAKEQHYGMGRKAVKTLFWDQQRNANRCSLELKGDLPNEFDGCEPNLNDDKQHRVIFDERQGSGNSSSHVEAIVNEVEDKDEGFEQRDFELKETSGDEQNHAIRPRDVFKKNKDNFQLNLKDRELSNMETKQEHFDASDNSVENLNASEGNEIPQSHVELGRRCREANVFMCDGCPKIFPNRAALKKHKRVHSDDMSFSCEICQQTFKYKGSLNRHVKEQHYGMGRKGIRRMFDETIGKNNGCLSVGNVYNSRSTDCKDGNFKEQIYNPRSTDCKDGNFKEQNFEQENFEQNERRLATKQVGISNNATTSKNGNFTMQDIDDFEHNLQHQQGTKFDNKQENFAHDDSFDLEKNKFRQEQNVDTKQNEVDSCQVERLEKTRMYRCPDCPRTFWNVSELREHTYKHTDIKSFPCKLCEKAFKFRSGLVRHNRKEHKKPDLIRNETRVCGIEENGFGEETLQQKRSGFETEERSVYCGQIGSNERLKRKFSEGKDDYETVLRMEKRCLNFESEETALEDEDRGSDFGKDVDANELVKRKFRRGEDSFETDIDNISEMEKGCLNFEFEETALEDEDHSSDFGKDIDANELRKRKFCGGEGDETIGKDETSFANEEMSVQSVRQNLAVKKKSSMYNCNKCDAAFKKLCDFLTHQSIHK